MPLLQTAVEEPTPSGDPALFMSLGCHELGPPAVPIAAASDVLCHGRPDRDVLCRACQTVMTMTTDFVLRLESNVDSAVLSDKLRQWEPWSVRIDFSNGVSTADLGRRVPFAENTLQKLAMAGASVPFEELEHGAVLDVGCNSGYNSVFCATEYGMTATGIDVRSRHIEVSKFLAETAGANAEFLLADAETFRRDDSFDVVLHFGTLYHLQNPLLSLESTFANLKSSGYLLLETQCYDDPANEQVCYFMRGHNNDVTNMWALSTKVLRECLTFMGFTDIEEVRRVVPALLAEHMSRVVFTARKP